jgi:hypothetical protein
MAETKKKTNSSYEYGDPVLLALRAAAVRKPRLYPSAQREYGEIVAAGVTRGEWTPVGDLVLRADGSDVESYLDECIAARTGADGACHWEIPDEIEKVQDDVWCGPAETALKRQGERWNIIRANFAPGREGDIAASKVMVAEAAVYGCKVGNPKPGTPPGAAPVKKEGAAPKLPGQGSSTNPWSPQFRDVPPGAKLAAQVGVIKSPGGPAQAARLSKACGVDLAGRPLRFGNF